VAALLLAYLSLRLEQAVPADSLYPLSYWALLIVTVVVASVSLLRPSLMRAGVNVAILLSLLTFAAFLRPFDGASGTYSADVQELVKGRTVWVPINFIAREEGHRFLLPGADVRGYPLDQNLTAADLAAQYPLFAVRVPMNASVNEGTVIGQRLDIGTRHTPEQIMDMLRGNVFEHLFVKELLVDSTPAIEH
jgi:hypothetical protein